MRAATAEREAEAELATARAEAEAAEHDAAEALSRELSELDERARIVREALVRAIEEDAARTVLHYRSLTDAEVESLAAFAIADATGLGAGGAA
ncbi:MAG: hypothetical protein ACHQQ3_07175 [Gemmatimonadales bacterium]